MKPASSKVKPASAEMKLVFPVAATSRYHSIKVSVQGQKRIAILTDSNPFFVAQNRCLDGLDCHDWFIEFRKLLMMDGKALIEAFSQTMIKDSDKVNSFLDELNEVLQ